MSERQAEPSDEVTQQRDPDASHGVEWSISSEAAERFVREITESMRVMAQQIARQLMPNLEPLQRQFGAAGKQLAEQMGVRQERLSRTVTQPMNEAAAALMPRIRLSEPTWARLATTYRVPADTRWAAVLQRRADLQVVIDELVSDLGTGARPALDDVTQNAAAAADESDVELVRAHATRDAQSGLALATMLLALGGFLLQIADSETAQKVGTALVRYALTAMNYFRTLGV